MEFLDKLFKEHLALAVLLSGAGVSVVAWLLRFFRRRERPAAMVSLAEAASVNGPVVATQNQSGGQVQVAGQIVNYPPPPLPTPAPVVLRIVHDVEPGSKTSGHFPIPGRIEREWAVKVEVKVILSVENVGEGAVRNIVVDVSPPPGFTVHLLPPDSGPPDATVRKMGAAVTRVSTTSDSLLHAKMRLPLAYARREFDVDKDDIQDAEFGCTLYAEGVSPVTETFSVPAVEIRRHIGAASPAPAPPPLKLSADEELILRALSGGATNGLTVGDIVGETRIPFAKVEFLLDRLSEEDDFVDGVATRRRGVGTRYFLGRKGRAYLDMRGLL